MALNVETSVDGRPVVEAESFAEGDDAAAHAEGAQLLWVHSNDDLSAHGFRRAGAYVRMHADEVPLRGREPSMLEERDYAEVLARAYSGLWGHKHVSPLAQPPDDAVVVGLPVVGLCRVFVAERLIDGPGVLPEGRSPDAYASLLVAACAVLGAGPADLDSWGDAEETIEAYEDLGFDVVDRVQGWELEL
ncbi:MAG TPA: hypothetical protein VIL77_09795 [Gaiellaceae bacterium]